MSLLPEPVWPVVVLAAVCLVDALLCLGPVAFVADCLSRVGLPRRWWRWLAVLKTAAAAGLILGVFVPGLGLVTASCLVVYFVLAIGAHVRARDFGRDLFLNATGMLALCVAVLLWCFLL